MSLSPKTTFPKTPTPVSPCALVIEDEPLVAVFVEQVLREIGITAEVSATLNEAVTAAIEQPADFALVDINLNGELAFPVVDICRARGLPVAIVSGYGQAALKPEYADVPLLAKPFRVDALIATAENMLANRRSRAPRLNIPRTSA